MKITILTSTRDHPVYPALEHWQREHSDNHIINLITSAREAPGGDFIFIISCSEIVSSEIRSRYRHSLVVHASDLPQGRGWSPHIWQILEGKNEIPVTLLEAEDKVDTGAIWLQERLALEGHELYDEINNALFEATLRLITRAVKEEEGIRPKPQDSGEPSYYPRRTPEDSRIDINLPLETQFDLLRVADPARFPAFFDYRGYRYRLRMEKDDSEKD